MYSAKYILDSDPESDQDSDPYLPSSLSPSPQQTNHLFPNIGHVDFDALGVEQGIEHSKKSGHSLRSDESSPEAEIASLPLVQIDATRTTGGMNHIILALILLRTFDR